MFDEFVSFSTDFGRKNKINFFNNTFNYYATLTLSDTTTGNNAVTNLANMGVTNMNAQSLIFTTLGDISLVDLTSYKIVAWYEMLNTDNLRYYSSNSISNNIEPYNRDKAYCYYAAINQ